MRLVCLGRDVNVITIMPHESVFPTPWNMWLLEDFASLAAFKGNIKIICIALDDVLYPVFTRFGPLKKLKNIHTFTSHNFGL
jgi:hypothetical protein